jgi:hypothetical protein
MIEDILLTPESVTTGSVITIIVRASDPDVDDNDDLTYDYEVLGGRIIGSGSQVTWQAPEDPGFYFITVTVTDPGGLEAEDEIAVEVIELNYEPSIVDGLVSPSRITNDKAETVMFTITLEDPNGLDDIYEVTIDLSHIGGNDDQTMYDTGKYGDSQSNDGVFSFEFFVSKGVPDGTKRLKVTVSDILGETDTYELVLVVEKGKSDETASGFTPGFDFGLLAFCLILITLYSYHQKRIQKKDSKRK